MAQPTMSPDRDLDLFCQEAELILGLNSRDSALITEFAERLYAFMKLRGLLSGYEARLLWATMAGEPRRFIPTLPRDRVPDLIGGR